MSLTLFVRY